MPRPVIRPLQFPSLQHFEARVEAICEQAQKSEGLSAKTVSGWRMAFSRLRAFLRDSREEEFLRGDVERQVRALLDWLGWLREGGANHTTVNTYWRGLHGLLLRLAAEDGTVDPTVFVETPRPGRPAPRFLTRDALEDVFSFVRNHQWRGGRFETSRNMALIAVMALGGCRLGEVLKMNVGDVTLSEDGSGTILIAHAKGTNGGNHRTVHMPPALWHTLTTYLAERRKREVMTGRLFVSTRDDCGIPQTAIRRLFRLITSRTGIRVAPHMLRHTCATLLRQAGVADRLAMEQLGHSSLIALQRYSHVVNGELAHEVTKVHVEINA